MLVVKMQQNRFVHASQVAPHSFALPLAQRWVAARLVVLQDCHDPAIGLGLSPAATEEAPPYYVLGKTQSHAAIHAESLW